jgi:hypothetical protein
MNPFPLLWTEAELNLEIDRVSRRIVETARGRDLRTRCTHAYLKQLLRHHRDNLGTLQSRRVH